MQDTANAENWHLIHGGHIPWYGICLREAQAMKVPLAHNKQSNSALYCEGLMWRKSSNQCTTGTL